MRSVLSLHDAIAIIGRSGIFDKDWYLRNYADVVMLGIDPIYHYLWIGRRLNRIPCANAAPGQDILAALDLHLERVEPPNLDGRADLGQTPARLSIFDDVHRVVAHQNGLAGTDLVIAAQEKARASDEPFASVFDASWYWDFYHSQIPLGVDPWEHFASNGRIQGLQPNEYFSPQWYLRANPDVAAAGVDPIDHYVRYGATEGRSCGPRFVQGLYEAQLKQPIPRDLNPLAHYLAHPNREEFIVSPQSVSVDILLDRLGDGMQLRPTKIAVGIVAFNQCPTEIGVAIASAQEAIAACGDDVSATIYLIDNSNKLVASNLPEDIRFFSGEGNVGFGRGQNRLMEVSFSDGAECYIGANPDGAFHPDCIVNLLKMNQKHEGMALIEALQFPEEHPKFYHPENLETEWCSGACFLLSRLIFEKTGGFDPNIFLYCEDVDLSWRARQRGFKTMTCPTAQFYHDVSDREYSPFIWREMLLAGRYLAHKWGDSKFRKYTEQQLLSERFFASVSQLPSLDGFADRGSPPEFANFSRLFSFATTRW